MIYEDMTYEVILERMIERVVESYPELDTREGSIIYNALAPAALELAIMYTELDNAIAESFVDTASREYILTHCEQMGMDISPFEETYGVHKALFNVEVPIGSRWNCDLYNYEVEEYIGVEGDYYAYELLCETGGTAPNTTKGALIAIEDIPDGFESGELVECLVSGENETSDEDIKSAYYSFVNATRTDGSVSQYQQWCNEFDGKSGRIGNHKIFPLWNGANTVKVSILNASNHKASEELIAEFQKELDPDITGMGNGKAPIGAFVTVSTATEVPISISADITMRSGYTDTTLIDTAISNYFADISYEKSIVSYMTLGAEILKVECVESIANLKVNGGTSDIPLGVEEIPTVGTLNWSVVV